MTAIASPDPARLSTPGGGPGSAVAMPLAAATEAGVEARSPAATTPVEVRAHFEVPGTIVIGIGRTVTALRLIEADALAIALGRAVRDGLAAGGWRA